MAKNGMTLHLNSHTIKYFAFLKVLHVSEFNVSVTLVQPQRKGTITVLILGNEFKDVHCAILSSYVFIKILC